MTAIEYQHGLKTSERGRSNAVLSGLIDQRGLMEELGIKESAAESIMRLVPKVLIPGLRKVYVKRADVQRVIDEATRL